MQSIGPWEVAWAMKRLPTLRKDGGPNPKSKGKQRKIRVGEMLEVGFAHLSKWSSMVGHTPSYHGPVVGQIVRAISMAAEILFSF